MLHDVLIRPPLSIRCGNRILDMNAPIVMGILNTTPDSFYDGGHYTNIEAALLQVERMLNEGAAIIDIGGQSTRPKAADVGSDMEMQRTIPVIEAVIKRFPEAILSIDTYRSDVAKAAVEAGAAIINDISGGDMDAEMFDTVAALQVPYIVMHIQGTPDTMQANPYYVHVVQEVFQILHAKIQRLRALGVYDIIIDPGFGFGKTVEHNFSLLKHLQTFTTIGCPVLAGLSRKSLINKVLGAKPEHALNATTALNMASLMNGANILRVHDVKEAIEVVKLYEQLKRS